MSFHSSTIHMQFTIIMVLDLALSLALSLVIFWNNGHLISETGRQKQVPCFYPATLTTVSNRFYQS